MPVPSVVRIVRTPLVLGCAVAHLRHAGDVGVVGEMDVAPRPCSKNFSAASKPIH